MLTQDLVTGDFMGTFARAANPGDRWIQSVCKNAEYFWQASPEFPRGQGGSWRVWKYKSDDLKELPDGNSGPLPGHMIRDLLGFREIRLPIDAPHIWYFRQLSTHDPIPPIVVNEESQDGDRIRLELSCGVVEQKAEILYRYDLRVAKDDQLLWDNCEILVALDPHKAPTRLARFEYENYRELDGLWLPMVSRLRRFAPDGTETSEPMEIRIKAMSLNKDIRPNTFVYRAPFASLVTEPDGATYRVGYVDPGAPAGTDVSDRRVPTTKSAH